MADAKVEDRNYCLDYIKGIACIFVVFMHCEFPEYLGVLVQCISRFCVPFFFMVSGYFCYRIRGGISYNKKIRHVAEIILGAVFFYLLVTPLYNSNYVLTYRRMLIWLLFNVPPYIAGQLWFLFALLYDYILFALFERLKLRKLAYLAIPVGMLAYILAAQGAYLIGHPLPSMFYRNFLIEGFPFFALGFWIHEHQEKIKVSNRTLLLVVIVSTLLCPLERLVMGRDFGINVVTFPQVIALFLFGVKNPGLGKGKPLSRLGAVYSMYVYIIHPAVWHLLDKLYAAVGLDANRLALYLRPILCVTITIMLSVAFLHVKKTISIRLKLKKV